MLLRCALLAAAAITSVTAAATPTFTTAIPLTTVVPSTLNFTYYFANAACAGPNFTQAITPNRCTFIEFSDGQGALSYAPFVRGNDFACGSACHLETWNAESCAGSPDSIVRAADASSIDCASTLGGKSVMLVC